MGAVLYLNHGDCAICIQRDLCMRRLGLALLAETRVDQVGHELSGRMVQDA